MIFISRRKDIRKAVLMRGHSIYVHERFDVEIK